MTKCEKGQEKRILLQETATVTDVVRAIFLIKMTEKTFMSYIKISNLFRQTFIISGE